MAKVTKLASNPPTGSTKQAKLPQAMKLAKKPPTQGSRPKPGHQGATRVGKMELHHTPSSHAQRIIQRATGNGSGANHLVGPGDNFAAEGVGGAPTSGFRGRGSR